MKINAVTGTDAEQAIAVMVLAFSTDPWIRWAFPDSHQYLTNFPAYVKALTGKAFEHQTVHYADHFCVASFRLAPDVSFDQDALVDFLLRAVSEHIREDIFALLEKIGGYHPDARHWYLPIMGVEPIQHVRRRNGKPCVQVDCTR